MPRKKTHTPPSRLVVERLALCLLNSRINSNGVGGGKKGGPLEGEGPKSNNTLHPVHR